QLNAHTGHAWLHSPEHVMCAAGARDGFGMVATDKAVSIGKMENPANFKEGKGNHDRGIQINDDAIDIAFEANTSIMFTKGKVQTAAKTIVFQTGNDFTVLGDRILLG